MWEFLTGAEMAALGSVIVIDIVMSGDNAVIIGMAAAGLPPELRRRAIIFGIAAATVLRVAFAFVIFQLLAIIGLTLAGGLLLLWVCWKMWRDIRGGRMSAPESAGANPRGATTEAKTLRQALTVIVVADVSMSLDNILAVAGAARDHLWVLIFGLTLSIALMAVAANYIARALERHYWLAYVGLAIVGYVAIDMIIRGATEVAQAAM